MNTSATRSSPAIDLTISSETVARSLRAERDAGAPTPRRIFHAEIAAHVFDAVRRRALEVDGLALAYSVKTSPRPEMLALARASGFFAEVISADEFSSARELGFAPEQIIYNGPRPLDREHAAIAFADSVEALGAYCRERRSSIAAIRYRPCGIDSRFGVVASELDACAALARQARGEGVALHLHVRPEDRGGHSWTEIAEDGLTAAERFADGAGKRLDHLDLGGGWTPEALDEALSTDIPRFVKAARGRVMTLQSVIVEPGQSIATPTASVATRILEIRRRGAALEAIVDSGYPDLPQAGTFEHRVFRRRSDDVVALEPGSDRICGSTCLEYDVLREHISLAGLRRGETLYFADAGSYDSSMAFPFAHGERYVARTEGIVPSR